MQIVLDRIEHEFDYELVAACCSIVVFARRGATTNELRSALREQGHDMWQVTSLLSQMRRVAFAEVAGVLHVAHESIHEALRHRYASHREAAQQALLNELLRCTERVQNAQSNSDDTNTESSNSSNVAFPLRALVEVPWLYVQLRRHEKVQQILLDRHWFSALYGAAAFRADVDEIYSFATEDTGFEDKLLNEICVSDSDDHKCKLAQFFLEKGQLQRSETLLQNVRAREPAVVVQHALLLRLQRKFEQAHTMLTQLLGKQDGSLNSTLQLHVLSELASLSTLLASDPAQAISLHRQILEMKQKMYNGDNNVVVAASRVTLANALLNPPNSKQAASEAENELTQAIKVLQQWRGERSLETAAAQVSLAAVHSLRL
ncbi:MAG: hypothetical protein MHM6MM_001008 [Cercozoa sp. M6MM]